MNQINNPLPIISSQYAEDNLWITFHQKKGSLKNKMDSYSSIALAHNHICHMRRRNKGFKQNTICEKCYSFIQSSIHPQIRVKMEENSNILNNPNYEPSKIYTYNNRLRYISFGDVQNTTQVQNILKHSQTNLHLNCAVWTKMYNMWKDCIDQSYPNLNLIWSCSKINNVNFVIPKGFNKSFYVYSDEEQLESAYNRAKILNLNPFKCGKQCKDCNHCYDDHDSSIVMELLK